MPARLSKGSSPNKGALPKQRVIAINQQMNALGRERRLTQALALLPQLRSQGLKPSAVTFNVLIAACTRCNDNARAAALRLVCLV